MLRQNLEQAGLGFDDFKTAFGPEAGTVTDWSADAMKPGLIITLDVRDRAKAQKFVETLAGGWPKQEIGGAQYYSFPQSGDGLIPVAPVLVLTDKTLLFGLDIESVKKAVQNTASASAKIDKGADFQTTSGLVSKPTGAFGYVDAKAFFERVYATAIPPLKMLALFNPKISENYGDLSKLPEAEVISKHLSPIVYSQSTDENGLLIESAGPVTFTDVLFFGGAAGAAYAYSTKSHDVQGIQSLPPPVPVTPSVSQPDATPVPPVQTAPSAP